MTAPSITNEVRHHATAVSRYNGTTIEGVIFMAKARAMTVRIPEEQADDLGTVAQVDDVPVAEAVREAIAEYIETRRGDPEFQNRLSRLVRENEEILARLAG